MDEITVLATFSLDGTKLQCRFTSKTWYGALAQAEDYARDYRCPLVSLELDPKPRLRAAR